MNKLNKVRLYNHGEDKPCATFLCKDEKEIEEAIKECENAITDLFSNQSNNLSIERISEDEINVEYNKAFLFYLNVKNEQLCFRVSAKSF